MLKSTQAALIDLLSMWLEEAELDGGEGPYAMCAHDLNALVQRLENRNPIALLKELSLESHIQISYTSSDDGIHITDDEENDLLVGWMFSEEMIQRTFAA